MNSNCKSRRDRSSLTPTSASLYPVVQDLTGLESNGCCCLHSDGSLSIGSFNFRDLSAGLPPLGNSGGGSHMRTSSSSSSSSKTSSSTSTNSKCQASKALDHCKGPLELRQSQSEDSAELRRSSKHHHHRRGFSLSLSNHNRGSNNSSRVLSRRGGSDSLMHLDTSSLVSSTEDDGGVGMLGGGPLSSSRPPPRTPTFEEQYVLTRMIFRCDHSQVWETVHRNSGQRYCVKIIENYLDMENDRISSEAQSLAAAQGPKIVRLVKTYHQEGSIYLVTEYLPSNLLTRVVQQEGLSEDECKNIVQSILQGVRHLHSRGMCHLDLQPSNILLASDGTVKICDFGSATTTTTYTTPSNNQTATPPRGHRRSGSTSSASSKSPRCVSGRKSQSSSSATSYSSLLTSPYAAPELVQGRRYVTAQADMWSIGVLLHFCLFGCLPPVLETRHKPTSSAASRATSVFTSSSTVPMISNTRTVSRAAKQLLSGLLHVDPTVRFTAREALSHTWFQPPYHEVVYKSSHNKGKENSVTLSPSRTAITGTPSSTTPCSSSRRPFFRNIIGGGGPTIRNRTNKKKDNADLMVSISSDCSTTEATDRTSDNPSFSVPHHKDIEERSVTFFNV